MHSVCGKVAVGENPKLSIPRGLCVVLELVTKKIDAIKIRFKNYKPVEVKVKM